MSEKIMRASKVGFPCNRNLWYSVTPGYEENISLKTQRVFDVGSYLEPLVVQWLNEDGWTVFYNPGSQNAKEELFINVQGGKISGHHDATMMRGFSFPLIMVDIKTMNDHAFTLWKRYGTLAQYPQYADQLHIYAEAFNRKYTNNKIIILAVVGVNKNNSDMHIDFFDYDKKRTKEIIKRTEKVFSSPLPPDPGNRMQDWCCSYCGYSHLCGIAQKKKDTAIGEKIEITDDEEIISAIEQLNFARGMKSDYQELENEAKAFLNEHVRKKGIKAIKGGNLILTLKECKSKDTFDVKGFTNFNPELAKQFTTNGNSYVKYEIKEA